MRKIFLLSWLITLFSISTFAKHVDENIARVVGKNFITHSTHSQILKSVGTLELVYTSAMGNSVQNNKSANTVFFYVFNTGVNGFVIVAGDDNVSPILGYSEEGAFDPNNIPQNTKKWLEGYKEQIRYVIDNNIDATAEIKEEWEKFLSGGEDNSERAGVNPLLSTKWNQAPYYNALCPPNTVTGCVATAMAQVMKYWNYPVTGTGFHSYNHPTYGTLSANFGSTTYNWAAMPNEVTSANNAVATLMLHCGISVDMNYGTAASGGSSASYSATENALKTYFGYKNTLELVIRSNYNQNQWIDLLKAELNASRPILYAGVGSGGGHAFVCDGYNDNGFFHFNWGWGGAYDGFFNINSLNPDGLGIGGGSGSFNSDQHAIIGIEPANGGVSPSNFDLKMYSDITMPSQIWFTSAFAVTVDFVNYGTGTFVGDFGAAIFDQNNNFVNFVEIESNHSLPPNTHFAAPLSFDNAGSAAFVPGHYTLKMFYRTATQDWTIVNGGAFTNEKQFEIYYSADIETYSAFTITTNGGKLIKGSPATVHVDVRNASANTFFGAYRVNLSHLNGLWAQNIEIIDETGGLPSGYHYTSGLNFSTQEITVEPGTYLLEIAYQAQGTSGWFYAGSTTHSNPIYVIVEAAGLSPDQYEVNNAVAQAYSLPVSFSGNTADVSTTGSNLHVGTDLDFYKINLPAGYDYVITPRLHDSYNSGNGLTYSVDGLFSYSTDGNTWSDAYDHIMPGSINVMNGGTVYFQVAPYFSGSTGTYLLDIDLTRSATTVGINESDLSGLISVYPNPAKDFVIIDLSNFSYDVQTIKVLNIQGKQISTINVMDGGSNIKLPLQELSDGVYFIQIQSTQGLLTKKIIINQ